MGQFQQHLIFLPYQKFLLGFLVLQLLRHQIESVNDFFKLGLGFDVYSGPGVAGFQILHSRHDSVQGVFDFSLQVKTDQQDLQKGAGKKQDKNIGDAIVLHIIQIHRRADLHNCPVVKAEKFLGAVFGLYEETNIRRLPIGGCKLQQILGGINIAVILFLPIYPDHMIRSALIRP